MTEGLNRVSELSTKDDYDFIGEYKKFAEISEIIGGELHLPVKSRDSASPVKYNNNYYIKIENEINPFYRIELSEKGLKLFYIKLSAYNKCGF